MAILLGGNAHLLGGTTRYLCGARQLDLGVEQLFLGVGSAPCWFQDPPLHAARERLRNGTARERFWDITPRIGTRSSAT